MSPMNIKVLGAGCARCQQLHRLTKEVVEELGLPAQLDYITDMAEIMKHGVMRTPALVVDGTIKVSGRVPSKAEIAGLLTTATTAATGTTGNDGK